MSMPKLPCIIECPSCDRIEFCSEEDPDAGQSQMWNHLYWDHALRNGRTSDEAKAFARDLLAKVTVAPDAS
jgi:hypothetical protein